MKKLLIILITISLFSCSKENNKYCWQMYANTGVELNVYCDKTESEIKEIIATGPCRQCTYTKKY